MKSVALITEYNPFHNGHVYHINASKAITNSDVSVAIMSGCFTMRGEPAILDKFKRAQMAIQHVDLVVELPLIYAISSGDLFAYGGVNIANYLKCQTLSFGSESGDIKEITDLVKKITNLKEQKLYKTRLKEGKSHPRIISELLGDSSMLIGSNNLLALEYVKHILNQSLPIQPYTIARKDNLYLDQSLNQDTNISSATSIRHAYFNRDYTYLSSLPDSSKYILQNYKGVNWNDFFPYLKWTIMRATHEELSKIYMMTEGLEYKLKKEIIKSNDFETFVKNIKSKRYTWTRIQRLLIATLLNIKKQDVENFKITGIRVLAMNEKGQAYLKGLKKEFKLPLITNINKKNAHHFKYEIKATELYQQIANNNENDFNQPVYINKNTN